MKRTRLSSGFIGRLLIMVLAATLAGVILGATAFAQENAGQDQYAESTQSPSSTATSTSTPTPEATTSTTPESTTEPTTPNPLTSNQSLESVDWRNTQYTTDCQGLAAQPFRVDVHNGEGHGPPDSTYVNGYIIRVEAVATGDLTGDGRPEAAVLLYCSPQPSNFFVQDVLVFTDGPDGPQLLAQLPELSPLPDGLDLPPVFDSGQFFIDSGQLVTGIDYYSATDSHAGGPSIHRVLIWQWDGSQFIAQPEQPSSRESQQLSGRGNPNEPKPQPDLTPSKVSDPSGELKPPTELSPKQPTELPPVIKGLGEDTFRFLDPLTCIGNITFRGPQLGLFSIECAMTLYRGGEQALALYQCRQRYDWEVCLGLRRP